MKARHTLRAASAGAVLALVAGSLQAQTIDVYPTPTQPSFPFGITAGPDGSVWAMENHTGRVARIAPNGTITEFVTGAPATGDITAGPDGNLWFMRHEGVGRITTTGVVTLFATPTATGGGLMTAGPDGNVWFTETGANRIGRVTPAGVITEFVLPRPSSQPLGITAGPDGNLWFTERTYSSIGRITPAGVITEFASPGFGWQIVTGPDGLLWYTDDDAHLVRSMSVLGVPVSSVAVANSWGPEGLTRKSNGHLWFTTSIGNTIGRMTVNGKIEEFTLPAGSGPREIVEGANGDIWFTMQNVHSIGRLVVSSIP